MKVRYESRGVHFYDRAKGYHLLLDECKVPKQLWSKAPSLVSIALTNACDLACEFCYAPKSPHHLQFDEVVDWCKQFDALGTLEVAFGGGEPTLYRDLGDLCSAIWEQTDLGISITTHGHHLKDSLIKRLQGKVSIIRVSVDAPEPLYSSIRRYPLSQLEKNIEDVRDRIPIGVNTVVNSLTIKYLGELATLVEKWQPTDWLILPETQGGHFTLTANEWATLSSWLSANVSRFQLNVTYEARAFLNCPFLFGDELDNDYAHVSADGYLRWCSYQGGGVILRNRTLKDAFNDLFRLPARQPAGPTIARLTQENALAP